MRALQTLVFVCAVALAVGAVCVIGTAIAAPYLVAWIVIGSVGGSGRDGDR